VWKRFVEGTFCADTLCMCATQYNKTSKEVKNYFTYVVDVQINIISRDAPDNPAFFTVSGQIPEPDLTCPISGRIPDSKKPDIRLFGRCTGNYSNSLSFPKKIACKMLSF
jgi:hypothetical protein